MPEFKKTVLSNGVRVVTERHPFARAVSLGLWVDYGSRDERPHEAGLAHMIEHLVFKGTKTRSAYQLALELESVGGELNAFTSKENTCFHSLTLKENTDQALDVVCDLVCHMDLKSKDFSLEKGVILQELGMVEDNLEELIYDEFFDRVYQNHPIARPILGTIKSVAGMTMKTVRDIYKSRYAGSALVLSVAGDIDHAHIVREAERLLRTKGFKGARKPKFPRREKPKWKTARWNVEKNGEQVHALWGFPTSTFKDGDRFCAFILNAALGGGMTSRLYQAVRERRGLVYNIHSSLNTFEDIGLITIYAAADGENIAPVHEIVVREIDKLRRKGLSAAQLDMFKKQLVGGLLLGADEVENRMHSLGVNELVFGRYRPVEDIVNEIEAIELRAFNKFLKDKVDLDQMSWVTMGPYKQTLE